jgi:hypothetical protein
VRSQGEGPSEASDGEVGPHGDLNPVSGNRFGDLRNNSLVFGIDSPAQTEFRPATSGTTIRRS